MVRRKRSNDNDVLGLGKFSKRLTLSNNRMRGRIAEGAFAMEHTYQGDDVKKIHVGGDFVVQKRDPFGRKIGTPTTHEIKSSPRAKLSEAQKRKQRQLKRKYKVERY
jgi:hypothetical protein